MSQGTILGPAAAGVVVGLCHRVQDAHSVFCVYEGVIKLSVAAKNGDNVVVEIFHEGESFAEALVFRDEPFPVSATTLADSKILAVPKSAIQAELQSNPAAFPAILGATYAQLHRLIRQVEQLKAASGLERIVGFVLALAEKEQNASILKIPYEKQTLASMLGIKPETLSRSFKRLSEHGLTVRGPTIEITNRAALEAFLAER